jgi:uncharacterized protein YdhG (YjbR/CyaY superfamily)
MLHTHCLLVRCQCEAYHARFWNIKFFCAYRVMALLSGWALMRKKVSGQVTLTDVDEYLANVPEPARSTLNKVRAVIRSVVPPETTEYISYGMPTFKYKGPLIGFEAFTNHCSLFPMSAALIESMKDDLKGFETAKGTIRFPLDKPPAAALLKKIARARVAQNENKKKPR